MKKLFTSLILLTMSMFLGSGSLWATTYYDLWVGGVRVSSDNATSITGANITGGTPQYNAAKNTLYLYNGTTISIGSDTKAHCINNKISGLTIVVYGTVTLTNNTTATGGYHPIWCARNTTIQGAFDSSNTPIMKVTSAKNNAILCGDNSSSCGADLTIQDIEMQVTSSSYSAIYAVSGYTSTLNVYGSTVTAKAASGYYGISGFKGGLNLDNYGFPTSVLDGTVAFNTSTGSVPSQNVTIYPALTIGKVAIIPYRSSSSYTTTSTGASSLSGSISLDTSTKTLTLNSLQIKGVSITNRVPGLIIKSNGTCSIENTYSCCYTYADTKFSGAGSLTLNSTSIHGITTAEDVTVTVSMKNLSCKGNQYGFFGKTTSELVLERLAGYNSEYKFSGNTCNVYTGKLTLTNMDIWTENQWFNSAQSRVYENSGVAKSSTIDGGTWFYGVNRFTNYNLTIFGLTVHNRNCSAIQYHVPEITAGTLTYNNSTKTLTMDGMIATSTLDTNDAKARCIVANDDINIKVSGTNKINTTRGAIICYGNTTLTSTNSSGTLAINTKYSAITQYGTKTFTIDCARLAAYSSSSYGFVGSDNASTATCTLAIKSNSSWESDIFFKGKTAAIGNTAALTLTDMDFYYSDNDGTPGCYFDTSKKAVCQNGGNIVNGDNIVNFYAVAKRYGVYVGGVEVTSCNLRGVGSPAITAGGGTAVTYSSSDKTLTLNNATINYTKGSNGLQGAIMTDDNTELSIDVVGNNTVKTSDAFTALYFRSKSMVNIEGSGTLNLSGTSSDLYPITDCTVNIRDNVTVNAQNKGIYSNNGHMDNNLTIGGNAVVKAARVEGIKNITLKDNQTIVEPKGAKISGNAIKVGDEVASNVVIKSVEKYDLYVGDYQVNSYNKDDILGDGKVSYNPATKTLNLNGVTYNNPSSPYFATSNIDGLTVNITGNNTIKTKLYILGFTGNTTIKGGGTLNGETDPSGGYGIFLNTSGTKSLKIDGPKINIKSALCIGDLSGNFDVTINSGRIAFEPNDYSEACAFTGIKSLTLGDGMLITEPDGGDYSNGYLRVGSDIYRGRMVIEKATIYDIFVADKILHSANCNDIFGDGKVSYNPATKTLTINGVNINDTGITEFVYNYGVDDLIINIQGNNTIKVKENIFRLAKDTRIIGSGTLNGELSATDGYGIWGCNYSDLKKLQIDGPAMTIKGEQFIGHAYNCDVVINSGKFVFEPNSSAEACAFTGIKSLTLGEGMLITEPDGGDYSDEYFRVGSDIYRGRMVIEGVTAYDLTVTGKSVHSANCNDILGDGTVSYNPSTKTLNLNGVNYNNTAVDNFATSTIDGLTVNITGNNTIKVDSYILGFTNNTTIKGNGTLNGETNPTNGIESGMLLGASTEKSLMIDGPKINIKSACCIGELFSCFNVTVNSGRIEFEPNVSTGACAFSNLKSFTLAEGLIISEPAGGYYDPALNSLCVDGAIYRGRMVIESGTNYGINIAGTTVNSINCNDILSNGVFKYNDATKTLTINGDYNNVADHNVIASTISDLTINVAGASTLTTSTNKTMISVSANTTITGGKLTLRNFHTDENNVGINISSGTLTIKDADLDISGTGFAQAISGTTDCKLVIDNSDIVAEAHGSGAIYEWGGITLNNCYVNTPRPSKILSNGIADGNDNIIGSGTESEKIVICTGADAINDIDVDGNNATEIYDASGRRIESTRRGINIIRTADGKVVKVLKK